MTESDHDLNCMFQALRRVDEGLAPAFDDVAEQSRSAQDPAPTASRRKPAWLAVAAVAVALVLVVGLVRWRNAARPPNGRVRVAVPPDLQQLNHTCDSLLATIRQIETAEASSLPDPEMEWPMVTASLVPFEVLTFHD